MWKYAFQFSLCRKYKGRSHGKPGDFVYEHVSYCRACQYNCRMMFWNEQVHDEHRFEVHWDRIEDDNIMYWRGDLGEEYHLPIPESPYLRREGVKGKEVLFDLFENGGRLEHTCHYGRMPENILFCPFVEEGRKWPKGGMEGYEAEIKITVVGMVDQSPPGRWQWIVAKEFELSLPLPFRTILGDWIEVDGWFRFRGHKASRNKKKKVEFVPRVGQENRLFRNVPKGTKLKIKWEELMIPGPCLGGKIWAYYAVLTKLNGFGRNKEREILSEGSGGKE